MIEKPSILITSLGRTATEFFARLFAEVIPDSTSLHEPDIYQHTGVQKRLATYLRQVQVAGAWRGIVLKALGLWTLVKLSDARFLGRMTAAQCAQTLEAQRASFIKSMPGSVYVEANFGYYGLLDITPHVFRRHRAICIVRDGRAWVRSHLNWAEAYGKRGVRKLISHNWPAAAQVPGDPYGQDWASFSRLERLCWAWRRLNEYMLDGIGGNPSARLFRFEDIFGAEDGHEHLAELLDFATAMPGVKTAHLADASGWLERRSHQSTGEFPEWEGWTEAQQTQFRSICAPLMERLGYAMP